MISAIESTTRKLARATVHIGEIKAHIDRYSSNKPGRVASQSDGEPTLDFSQDPDIQISILAGEVIYQIKSSLDHLAFDLVKLNPGNIELPKRWERKCEFPLLLDVPLTGDPPVPVELPLPYNFFKDRLPGISKQAFTFIEAVQPYYRLNTANVLRPVEQLANIDKHRYPHVLDPQAYHTGHLSTAAFNHTTARRVARGDKLDPLFPSDWLKEQDAVYVETIDHATVRFGEAILDEGTDTLPVDHLLQLCVNEVQTIIIPAFSEFLKNA